MKKLFFLTVLVFLLVTTLVGQGWRQGEMEVRVDFSSPEIANQIALSHFNGDIYANHALLYVTPSELLRLNAITRTYEITKKDLDAWSYSFNEQKTAYHSYAEIIALADSLAENFPAICQKYNFGTSYEDRQLVALKISDNAAVDEPEAEVMFDAGIHGDEIGGPENVIRFARDLCLDYGSDPEITALVDNREIWLYLMVNPDGRVNMVRYNANGVDLNRDWAYMWNGEGSSYGPVSQNENRALRNCAYNNQFVIHTTYHSGTEYISCPWSYRSSQPADLTHILQLAGVYASTSGYANIPYGQGNTGMYPINGSSKDFNYGAMGSISWSMEISNDKQPSVSQLLYYYNANVPAMKAMIEYSGYGLEGMITDVETGEPVAAVVFVNDYFPCYTDPEVGDFHKYVLPGNYSVTVKANGYESMTMDNVEVGALSSSAVDMALTPLENSDYAYKICASHIPDNNSADEGYTPGIIGAPDNINYSIGKDGWIVFDMLTTMIDSPGDEIELIEGDESPEGYTLYAGTSMDGPWAALGSATGTAAFDLADGNIMEARFFKIVDDGDGQASTGNAGFDFDAAHNIAQPADLYLAMMSFSIDEVSGNNNGIPDPGENIDIHVNIRNNGSLMANEVVGALTCLNPNVMVNNATYDFGDINSLEIVSSIFNVDLNEAIINGTPMIFTLALTAENGAYTRNVLLTITAGEIIEDFETGDYSSLPWKFSGTSDWTISSPGQQGDFAAQSGTISDNQQSALVLSVNVLADGEISFFRKVSSESGYDFLEFYIDNTLMEQWSGTMAWGEESYAVSAGNHSFSWVYKKDGYSTNGSDCGWIDSICFPSIAVDGSGELEGCITDLASGDAIPGAAISVLHLSMYYFCETTSDELGDYSLNDLPAGEYEINAFADGYIGVCDTVVVLADEMLVKDIPMVYGVGMNDFKSVQTEVNCYPNPVDDGEVVVVLTASLNESVWVSVWSPSGECVFHEKQNCSAGNEHVIIPADCISSLANGLYTVQLCDGNNLYISKIIKF